jgi:PhnB protein
MEADPMYIPPGFGTVTPYFVVKDARRFIDFLVRGLHGTETLQHLGPDGTIAHAQVKLGTTTVMLSEATAQYPPISGHYYYYVEDADAAVTHALACGAVLEREIADMPYGDRQGGVRDAHGNIWWLSQRLVREPYTA